MDNKEQRSYNNQYISSIKMPNESLVKSDTDKNRAINGRMRPFSTRKQFKKKNLIY